MARRWVAVTVAVVVGAAACSTTAKHGTVTGSSGSPGSGTATVPLGASAGPGGATSGSGAGAAATGALGGRSGASITSSGSPGSVASGNVGAGGSSSSGSRTLATAPGVTATTITVGIQVDKPINYASFGGSKSSSADQASAAVATVNYINAHGGIAGRKLVGIVHQTDVTSGTFAQQAQAACTDFTEDHKVIAATASDDGGDNAACYLQHNTVYVTNKRILYDQTYLQQYPNTYLVGRMSASRWGVFVDGLAKQGFFSGGAKVAMLRYDQPDYKRVSDLVIKPRLAHYGVKLTDEFAISEPSGVADLGGEAATLGNAVVKMRGEGVDHVLFLDDGGAMVFLYMPEAQSQGYHAVYGLNSDADPQFQEENQAGNQLHGALGVGWVPADDVNLTQDPGGNPAYSLCINLLRQAGLSYPDRASQTTVLGNCDDIFFIKTVLERAQALTPAGFRDAAEGLGDAYNSAYTFATHFAPGRHDGPSKVRLLGFNDACNCFKYTGPLISVG